VLLTEDLRRLAEDLQRSREELVKNRKKNAVACAGICTMT